MKRDTHKSTTQTGILEWLDLRFCHPGVAGFKILSSWSGWIENIIAIRSDGVHWNDTNVIHES